MSSPGPQRIVEGELEDELLPMPGEIRVCRICGCTDDNACLGRDGAPCHWVTGDLCSACMEV